MKTWYVTNVTSAQLLAEKLQDLETSGHTIFSVVSLSGSISIVSYIF